MRTAQSPSIDFNQMLVVSVFFHFLLFTIILFLPPAQNMVKHIKPAFMVSLVNIPTGPEVPPAPPVKEAPVVPENPAPPAQAKPVPEKPRPVPEKPAVTKALVSKLDQVAKLDKKTPPPKAAVPKKTLFEDTFQDLDSLKEKRVPKKTKKAMVAPAPVENVFEGFDDIKMKTQVKKKTSPTRKQIAKEDLTLKELEFEHLSKQKAASKAGEQPQKSSNLLKELEDLDRLNRQASAVVDPSQVSKPKPNSRTARLLQELESITKKNVQVSIDTSKLSASHSQTFKSEIRNLQLTNLQRKQAGPAASGETGDPGADALSRYIGEVYAKIFENWKDPLGGGNGSVQISFTLFPKGNIAAPRIMIGSGDSKLDNLAILAVKNAVPLPPFPREIKEPNLPLILKFDYVPSKN